MEKLIWSLLRTNQKELQSVTSYCSLRSERFQKLREQGSPAGSVPQADPYDGLAKIEFGNNIKTNDVLSLELFTSNGCHKLNDLLGIFRLSSAALAAKCHEYRPLSDVGTKQQT